MYFLPGGGRAASTFEALLYVAFGVAIGYLGLRFYREHRIALHGLGDRHRGLLYGGARGGGVRIAARARMWETGLGELVWFVLSARRVRAARGLPHWRTTDAPLRPGPIGPEAGGAH